MAEQDKEVSNRCEAKQPDDVEAATVQPEQVAGGSLECSLAGEAQPVVADMYEGMVQMTSYIIERVANSFTSE